jgi:hypothetical protein
MKKIGLHSVWITLTLLTITFMVSCTTDQLPEPMEADCGAETPTYSNEIKFIIDESCAYSGCHLDSSPGRFDNYGGLLPYLEDNTLRQRVLIQRGDPVAGMPPNNAPDGRAKDLTEEQLTMIECWLDAGFPE